ncbi:WAT1-related protein At5g64700 isoform X2 [Oryza sativa Japonica Group]|uniref:WAT1-related protein At5g64700 isoform X2 n=1 Tax=Oryza sativa subsp. japonica TaxID=39947 RepID=UPI0001C7A4D0|nr:WAT1-related protein At5g64700 isoform X4 [Oryza sativa Japonica Group]
MDIDGAGTKAAAAGWKAPASMVLVQLFITGMIMLSKVSIGGGMFIFALLAYRSLFGAVFILPFALIFERGKWRDMDWRAFGWIFFNAFIGYAVPMSLYFYGLKDTTASYAVIFINIIPLFAFILSLMFRLETFEIGSIVGVLKIVGVLLSVGGTMLVSLYKGKSLHLWNSILQHQNEPATKTATNQLRGTILLVASSFAYACWYLVQVAFVGIILRRHKSAWKLGWDLNLVTVVYSGALATGGKYSLNSWVVAKRGPAYPPMFNPLSVVFTVVLDSVLMGDDVTVGSIIGTAMVIVGLYLFLWAKA